MRVIAADREVAALLVMQRLEQAASAPAQTPVFQNAAGSRQRLIARSARKEIIAAPISALVEGLGDLGLDDAAARHRTDALITEGLLKPARHGQAAVEMSLDGRCVLAVLALLVGACERIGEALPARPCA